MEKLRKNKDESFTVQTSEHLPVGLALALCYSKDKWHENEYFCYTWEDCLDDFVEKMNEILGDFEAFPRKKLIAKKKNSVLQYFVTYVVKNSIEKTKNLLKILLKRRIIVITLENIETLLIY